MLCIDLHAKTIDIVPYNCVGYCTIGESAHGYTLSQCNAVPLYVALCDELRKEPDYKARGA